MLSGRGEVWVSSMDSSSGGRIHSDGSVVTPQLNETSRFASGGRASSLGLSGDCSLSGPVPEEVATLMEVKMTTVRNHICRITKNSEYSTHKISSYLGPGLFSHGSFVWVGLDRLDLDSVSVGSWTLGDGGLDEELLGRLPETSAAEPD